MRLILFALFVALPILEIYVIIQVGQEIGAMPTLLLLVADALLGAWLVKREGRRAWEALNEAIQAGQAPGQRAGRRGVGPGRWDAAADAWFRHRHLRVLPRAAVHPAVRAAAPDSGGRPSRVSVASPTGGGGPAPQRRGVHQIYKDQ